MAYDPNNPFQPFNTSPMSLLNVGGFRQPGDNQGLAPQNVFNQQQFNQNQQSNDLKRRQQLGNVLLAFSDVFRGKDPSSGVLQRQQLFRQQQEEEEQKAQQAELQKMQEEFFKDPKYKNMAKIFGIQFAYQQRQSDMASEIEAQENQKFLDNVKGTVFEKIANIAGVDQARGAYINQTLDPKNLPADIQKLNTLKSLRERLDPTSPNYDPNYTTDQYSQDASILGVNANLLKGKQQFISEYAKQMRTAKTLSGERLYNEQHLKDMGEEAYQVYFGNEVEQTEPSPTPFPTDNGDIIDLGSLD